jgi:spermidine synthase
LDRRSEWAAAGKADIEPGPLLAIVLVIATAGLVYELVIAAVASYLLGDSITQFSLVIGLYLSALGIGAYLSRFVSERLALTFVDVELATALIGGFCAPGLFLAFSYTDAFRLILYGTVLVIGTLVGLELPLLIRILERRLSFKDLIARALTFDYLGALLGSLGFSLLLVPSVGLVKSSLVCGLLNAGAGLTSTFILSRAADADRAGLRAARLRAIAALAVLAVGLLAADRITQLAELALYRGRVIFAEQSPYQRIVLSEVGRQIELHLNGHLQFSSADEYRYHEALVHPAMAKASKRERVLIGGGGDGLAAREALKWPEVRRLTLVDLDPRVTHLAQTHARLLELNRRALHDPRVEVINDDALRFLRDSRATFDVVIVDFPDPTSYSLGKLYSVEFYRLLRTRLAPGGAVAVQATSPLFARRAFWCIVETLTQAGFSVRPYHAFLPSFGEWGFVLATTPSSPATDAWVEFPNRHDVRFLSARVLPTLFEFSRDMGRLSAEPNRLNNQALVSYYREDAMRWD